MATYRPKRKIDTAGNTEEIKLPISAVNGLSDTLGKKANTSDIPTKVSELENDSKYNYEAYFNWGGQHLVNKYSPIDATMNPYLSPNRLAGIKAAGVSVEYSNDGGATWVDYGMTDAQKVSLITTNGSLKIGGPSKTAGSVTANDMVRVTLDGVDGGVYTALNKVHMWVTTNGSSDCTVTLESYDYNNSTEWHTVVDNQQITGWSGWNVLNFTLPGSAAFGGTNNTKHQRKIRFTFKHSSCTSDRTGLYISRLYAYGGMGWSAPSNLALYGTPYSYDYASNTTFPANVKAVSFTEGNTALSSKYLGISAKASDSAKLNGQEASYYLNYNNLSNKPTIPTAYAGSSSAGGSATSAVKLDTSAGSATQPVYFSGGKPVATTYTLGASVPSGAKFTDTDTGATSVTTSGSGNAVTTASYDASTRKLTLTKGTTFLTSHQSLADLGITATATELNYTDGVTSNIQTQLNGKQAKGQYVTSDQAMKIQWSGSISTKPSWLLAWSDAGSTIQGVAPDTLGYASKSEIPTNYVTTNTDQTNIAGKKTFTDALTANNGLGVYCGTNDDGTDKLQLVVNNSGVGIDNLNSGTIPLSIGGSAGTSGQVLTSQGAGVTPKWEDKYKVIEISSTSDVLSDDDLETVRKMAPDTLIKFGDTYFFYYGLVIRTPTYVRIRGMVSDMLKINLSTGAIAATTTMLTTLSDSQTISGKKTFSGGVDLTSNLLTSGSAGTSGQVLTSQGTGSAPVWAAPSSGIYTPLQTDTTIDATTLSPGVYYWSLDVGTYTLKWKFANTVYTHTITIDVGCLARVTIVNIDTFMIDTVDRYPGTHRGTRDRQIRVVSAPTVYTTTTYNNWVAKLENMDEILLMDVNEIGCLDISTGCTLIPDGDDDVYHINVYDNDGNLATQNDISTVADIPFHCTINRPQYGGITGTVFQESGVITKGTVNSDGNEVYLYAEHESNESSIYIYVMLNGSVSGTTTGTAAT